MWESTVAPLGLSSQCRQDGSDQYCFRDATSTSCYPSGWTSISWQKIERFAEHSRETFEALT
jgi:hypothetical protein